MIRRTLKEVQMASVIRDSDKLDNMIQGKHKFTEDEINEFMEK